jgi:hypothetical protein
LRYRALANLDQAKKEKEGKNYRLVGASVRLGVVQLAKVD